MSPNRSDDTATLGRIRRLLLLTLLVSVPGMATELLFLGHIDGVLQLVPVTLLAAGLLALGWLALAPGPGAVRLVRVLMAVFVASGVAGVGLHARGNMEFELEMYPDRAGAALVRKTLTGATPVLAPATMALLGLVGLALTYHHPALGARSAPRPRQERLP
jgi:hypothetical protein